MLEVVLYVWILDLYYLVSNSQMVSGIPNQSVTRLSVFWVKFREMVKINFLAWNNISKWFEFEILYLFSHGLRTPDDSINQRYLKNWADVADKICCRHT